MQQSAPRPDSPAVTAGPAPLPFIVIGKGRSGTTLLVQALNSHPHVRCFGELFNWRRASIDFGLPGHDGYDAAALRLRERDPIAFLRQLIYAPRDDGARAVGFKLLYQHYLGLNVRPAEIGIDELHVIHVRRRNVIRSLVSAEIAERTGEWLSDPGADRGAAGITPHKLRYALTHPAWAAAGAARRLRSIAGTPKREAAPTRVALTPQQVREYVYSTSIQAESYDDIFRDRPGVSVWYEDMAADLDGALRDVWGLLGVEAEPVAVSMRRQNPQSLRELIENYDELRAAFANTPIGSFFDEEDA